MGRGNPKAFEGKREATQFKAAGNEPLIARVDLRVTPTMATELKAIDNWQKELRTAISTLIEKKKAQSE